MLQNLDDPDSIGPAMAVALLTTLYGAILAFVVYGPIGSKYKENRRRKSRQEARDRRRRVDPQGRQLDGHPVQAGILPVARGARSPRKRRRGRFRSPGLDPSEAEDHVCEEGAPAWLATMGDLMSLLLVFFVLMLSFANMDNQLFTEAMGSIQNALGVPRRPGKFHLRSLADRVVGRSRRPSSHGLEKSEKAPSMDQKIMQMVQQAIAENNLSRIVDADPRSAA